MNSTFVSFYDDNHAQFAFHLPLTTALHVLRECMAGCTEHTGTRWGTLDPKTAAAAHVAFFSIGSRVIPLEFKPWQKKMIELCNDAIDLVPKKHIVISKKRLIESLRDIFLLRRDYHEKEYGTITDERPFLLLDEMLTEVAKEHIRTELTVLLT